MIELFGTSFAIIGSILACYGVWVFNVRGDPRTANLIWSWSNPLLCVWAVGYLLNLWDGGILPIGILAAMYGYYTVSSWWGWYVGRVR